MPLLKYYFGFVLPDSLGASTELPYRMLKRCTIIEDNEKYANRLYSKYTWD